jgi:hypothetical protein
MTIESGSHPRLEASVVWGALPQAGQATRPVLRRNLLPVLTCQSKKLVITIPAQGNPVVPVLLIMLSPTRSYSHS